jgi:YbbR domain-containing protein
LREALFENVGLKFVSLVLALTVFILVNTGQDREIVARVGVSYTLPDDKELVSGHIDAVRITVRGPWNRIRHFDERELDRVDLDLTHMRGGDVPITPDMIKLPAGLTLTSITPRFVHVVFEAKRTKEQVAIEPVFAGEPQHGYVVDEAALKRALPHVTVRGADGVVSALSSVHTETIPLTGRSESFAVEVQLAPLDGLTVAPDRLTIEVPLVEKTEDRTLESLPVAIDGDADPARLKLEPPVVDVVVHGKLLGLERFVQHGVAVHIDVSAADAAHPHAATVVVEDLPPDLTYHVVPAQVMVTPKR